MFPRPITPTVSAVPARDVRARNPWLNALLLSFICLCAAAARADVVFSRPQSPTGGLINSSWVPPDGTDADRYAWDSFVLTSAATITEIQWQGDGFGNGVGFTIVINNAMTLPDPPAALGHYTVPGNAGQTPAGIVNGFQRYNYHYVLPTPLQLAGGIGYVINIEGTGGWSASYGTGGDGSHIDFIVGLAMFLRGSGDPAFTLIGTSACTAPSIITHPSPAAMCVPGPSGATFSVAASGTAPLNYRWRKGAVPMDIVANPSAATATLSLANISAADAGSYDCVVTNTCNSATSNPATLTVNAAPAVSQQPASVATCPSSAPLFSVVASGAPAPTYQWQWRRAGQPQWLNVVAGANTDATAFFQSAGGLAAQLGITNYQEGGVNGGAGVGASAHAEFQCILTGTCGSVTSSVAALTVCPADFNCSGTLEVADIFDFLNAWFAGVAAADFDGVNGLQVADIFAFLNTWFAGC
jgi:hypothetical protein